MEEAKSTEPNLDTNITEMIPIATKPANNIPSDALDEQNNDDRVQSQFNEDTKQNEENRIIATLGEDIWALGYVLAKKEKGLPCSYALLLALIFVIQFGTLFSMIYSFYCSVVFDVAKETFISSHRCLPVAGDLAPNFNELDYDTFGKQQTTYNNYTTFDLSCYRTLFAEESGKRQWFYGAKNQEGIRSWDQAETAVFYVFLLSQTFSFCVLSIYIVSSMMNPLVMFTIAYNQNGSWWDKLKRKPYCGNCNRLSCAIRTIARLNLFLSMSAFIVGAVIIFTYPTFFGIESPVDIIFTPISLVFILEVDNWMFKVVKQFYPETINSDLWTIKALDDEIYNVLIERKKLIWIWMRRLIICVLLFAIFLGFMITWWNEWRNDDVFQPFWNDIATSSLVLGFGGIVLVFVLWFISYKCGSKILGMKIPYEDEDDSWTGTKENYCQNTFMRYETVTL